MSFVLCFIGGVYLLGFIVMFIIASVLVNRQLKLSTRLADSVPMASGWPLVLDLIITYPEYYK